MSYYGHRLDPDTHDLQIRNGSPVWISVDSIEEWAAQAIGTRLRFFRGEYFLDLRQGIPHYTVILRKGYSEEQVKSVLRQAILSVPFVATLDELELDVDRSTREAAVSWSATLVDGGTVTSDDFGALIIEL